MRLDGDDPIRLLLVEPREIQANLKRSEIDVSERNRLSCDIEFVVGYGDAAELLLRGEQFGVKFPDTRNGVTPPSFDRRAEPAQFRQEIVEVSAEALELTTAGVLPAASLGLVVKTQRFGQSSPYGPRRLGGCRRVPVPPVRGFEV